MTSRLHTNPDKEFDLNFTYIVIIINKLKFKIIGIIILAISISAVLIGLRLGVSDPVFMYVELEGIKNKKYPNGTNFSPNDLASAEVLEQVKLKFGINDYKKLRDSISVEYGSLAVDGINKKYQEQLAQRNLTQADIIKINANYSTELEGAVLKGIRISFDQNMIGVTEQTAKEIVAYIPQEWSRIYKEKFKILEDVFLASNDIPSNNLKLTDATSFVKAYQVLRQMNFGIKNILGDNRVASVKSDDGQSAADIYYHLEKYCLIYCNKLNNYYLKLDEVTVSSFNYYLKLNIAELDEQIGGIDSVINAIRQEKDYNTEFSTRGNDQKGTGLQIGENGLTFLVDLADKASLSTYLKGILDRKISLLERRSLAKKEYDLLNMKATGEYVVNDEFKQESEKELLAILKSYTELLLKGREKLQSDQNNLFVAVGAPVGTSIINKNIAYQIIATFGLSLGIVIVLLAKSIMYERSKMI